MVLDDADDDDRNPDELHLARWSTISPYLAIELVRCLKDLLILLGGLRRVQVVGGLLPETNTCWRRMGWGILVFDFCSRCC